MCVCVRVRALDAAIFATLSTGRNNVADKWPQLIKNVNAIELIPSSAHLVPPESRNDNRISRECVEKSIGWRGILETKVKQRQISYNGGRRLVLAFIVY